MLLANPEMVKQVTLWRGCVAKRADHNRDYRSARRHWVMSTLRQANVDQVDVGRGIGRDTISRCSRAVGWSAAGAEVLLALGGSFPLAVDLEACAPRHDFSRLVWRYFSSSERARIWSAQDREAAFA